MPAIYPASLEIIVPARNEASRLPDGLAALCRKAATLPVRTAILVVDSASTDATAHVVRTWAAEPVPVRLLRCPQPIMIITAIPAGTGPDEPSRTRYSYVSGSPTVSVRE